MVKLIKTLDVQNASLNVITAGRRFPLAQFAGKIEITEHQSMTFVLGRRCKGEKKIYASFILCQNIEYQTDDEFNAGKVYEARIHFSKKFSICTGGFTHIADILRFYGSLAGT